MPLDTKTINNLKDKLLTEKNRLQEELGRIGKRAGTSESYETYFDNIGTHEDENASEVEEYADNLALEDSLEKQLKDVDFALEKIENGIYGTCEICKKNIDIDRLQAYPAAKTCIHCK